MSNPDSQRRIPNTQMGESAKAKPLEETMDARDLPGDNLGETVTQEPPRASSKVKPSRPVNEPKQRAASAKNKPKPVTQIGDFRLVKKLGQGGMGEVYLANQVSLDRKVAIKVLAKELAKKPGFVERFLREARSMAKIDHPNAVRVYGIEEYKGVHFVAIEYIDGQSMQDWMDQLERLTVGDALHVTLDCARVLKHAYEMNLIHRDVKPDNILITKKGVVKVSDFGLAKALGDQELSLTQSGTGLGTPLYMAPEQARNAKNVDHRADIYALGSTLYYFLTGKQPFSGDTLVELIQAKDKGKFRRARLANPEVPERLDLMIDKMIARDVAHRYATWDELVHDLENLGLETAALSFIAGAETTVRPSARTAPPTQAAADATAAKVGVHTSGEGVARTQVAQNAAEKEQVWFVKHTNPAGKVIVSKMTTSQVQRGIRGELIDLKAQAKKPNESDFLPLAYYAEFETDLSRLAAKAEAAARSVYMKGMYRKIDRAERFHRRWGWLKRLTEGTLGFFGLIIYLAIVAAIGFAIWRYLPDLIKLVRSKIGSG